MKVSREARFRVMGIEVILLGFIVFLALGLGVMRTIASDYASELFVRVGSLSINLEYSIIGMALIIVGYEILSFTRNELAPRK